MAEVVALKALNTGIVVRHVKQTKSGPVTVEVTDIRLSKHQIKSFNQNQEAKKFSFLNNSKINS